MKKAEDVKLARESRGQPCMKRPSPQSDRAKEATPVLREEPTRTIGRGHVAILLGILIAAGVLRFYQIGKLSFWLDELYSLASSTARYPDTRPLVFDKVVEGVPDFTSLNTARPWWHIWSSMHQGTHPPLYIVILRGWREIFGGSDAAARALSAVVSLISIVIVFDIARILCGTTAGLWTAALMAVAWPQLQFAQEARPYALLAMFGMGAMWAMARIWSSSAPANSSSPASGSPRLSPSPDTPRLSPSPGTPGEGRGEGKAENRSRPGFLLLVLGACMFAMALTHYFAFGALVALGIFALIALRGSTRWKVIASMAAAGALYLALWGPALWQQRHSTNFVFLTDADPGHIERTIWFADELPFRYLVDLPGIHWLPMAGMALVILTGAMAFRRRELMLPWIWLVCSAGFIVALDMSRSTLHTTWLRYTMLAAPGLYLLLCGLPARQKWGLDHVIPALAVVFCITAIPEFYTRQKEDWRGLGAFVNRNVGDTEPLVFAAATEQWYAMDLCICLSRYAHYNHRAVIALDGPAPAGVFDYLRKNGHAWVISDNVDVRKLLPGCDVVRDQRVTVARGAGGEDPTWFVREVEFKRR